MSLWCTRRVLSAALVFAVALPASAFGRDAYVPPALDSVHAVAAIKSFRSTPMNGRLRYFSM